MPVVEGTKTGPETARAGALATRARILASHALPPTVLAGAALLAWGGLSDRGVIPRFILPAPGAVAQVMLTQWPVLLKHAGATTYEALLGFAIGNTLAVMAALAMSWSRIARACFYPLSLVTPGIPFVAITPLLVLVFGRGMPPIVAVVSIAVSFPTFLNMVRGLASADAAYHEMLHSLSASPWQRIRMVELPTAMPHLFAALKVSASAAFICALVGEWIGTNVGLGYLVVISAQYFKLPMLWAAITAAALLTLLLLGAVSLAERLLHRWTAAAADL